MKAREKYALEERLVGSLARSFPLSPNWVTLLSIVLMLAACVALFQKQFGQAGLLVLLSGLLDVVDGTVARVQGKATRFGNFFDKLADKINDSMIPIAAVLFGLIEPVLGLLAVFFVLISSYESAVLEIVSRGKRTAEELSLRPLRVGITALGAASSRLPEAMALVIAMGVYSFLSRAWTAWKLEKKH